MKEKKISALDRRVTELFRSLMTKYQLASSQFDYVFDGVLKYRGTMIEHRMTEAEERCLDHSVRQAIIESLEVSCKGE